MTNWLKKIQETISKLNPPRKKPVDSEQLASGKLETNEGELQEQLTVNDHSTTSQDLELESSVQESSTESSQLVVKSHQGKPLYKRYRFWLGMGLGSGAIALIWGWTTLEKSLPDISDAMNYARTGTMTVKSSEGIIIQQVGENSSQATQISEIPKELIQAIIAAEDKRFYQHHGVDYQGVIRAAFANVTARNVVEGGSTITQQLARIIFLDQKKSWIRKLREIRIAQKIEEKFSKDQILEKYLNTVYFGGRAYGISDAAAVYFSKAVKALTLPEIATLAGIVPAPSEFSPLINKELAKQRRDLVLKRMSEQGFISKETAEQAIATPLELQPSPPKVLIRQAHYFTDYIQSQIPKYISKEKIAEGGLIVETTINLEWQELGEQVIKKTVETAGKRDNFDQAALVAIDPKTGAIKAMVGGKDFTQNQFNRVTQAQRQPGSTFKTFVYSTAIAAGFSPYKSYLDAPYKVDGYEPKNFNENKYSGYVTMREALTNSTNIVAVKVLIDVGWDTVIDLTKKMGIESPLNPTYSLALGSSEVNLLELTSAYGTFANQGEHIKVHGINRILDRKGNVIYQADLTPVKVFSPETTAIVTWMLQNVVNNGTATAAQLDDRPVAGKTGTTDEVRDLWFIGYIPQVVTGVWLGNDDNKPTYGASSVAAAVWSSFMSKIVNGMPVEKFTSPPEKLEGRKAEITISKIKPQSVVYGKIPDDDQNESKTTVKSRSNYRQDDEKTEPRRKSRRNYRQKDEQSENQRSTSRQQGDNNQENDTNRKSRRRAARSQENDQQRNQSDNNNKENSTPRKKRLRDSESQIKTPNNTNNNEGQVNRRSSRSEEGTKTRERRERRIEPISKPPAPPAAKRSSGGNSNVVPPAPPAEKRNE